MNKTIITLAADIVGNENCRTDEPMSRHTTFRVGGTADLYLTPDSIEQLISLIELFKQHKTEYYIIGNGSNILVGDRGIRGAVIEIGKEIGEISIDGDIITAEAGVLLSKLAAAAAKNGLSGLEFASGIPGSLGGAVYMNAGAYGGEMKDIVREVRYLDESGRVCTVSGAECDFAYRRSCFTDTDKIILSAKLKLTHDNPDEIRTRINELTAKRVAKQPVDKASAGSTFKRPEGYFAAALIEECGLKGYTAGGASVSEKHSGFVVNNGGATAKDVCDVISHVKETVKAMKNVNLETEVKFLGEFE